MFSSYTAKIVLEINFNLPPGIPVYEESVVFVGAEMLNENMCKPVKILIFDNICATGL